MCWCCSGWELVGQSPGDCLGAGVGSQAGWGTDGAADMRPQWSVASVGRAPTLLAEPLAKGVCPAQPLVTPTVAYSSRGGGQAASGDTAACCIAGLGD